MMTTEPMRVMKFVPAFFTGGTERQFISLARGFDPARVTVRFGCLRKAGDLLSAVEAAGIPVIDYNVRSFRHPGVLSSQLRLARDLRRHRIEVVHTYGFASHLFAIPAAKLAGVRVVASIRDLGVYLSGKQLLVQRLLCRFADHILVNASAIREWLIESGYDARRITTIPNGIDTTRFDWSAATAELRTQLGSPADAPLIGVLGRVSRMKGIEDFLNAAGIVSRRFPQARFLIIGDALVARGRTVVRDEKYMNELQSLTERLGIRDRVSFLGFRPDADRILTELSVSVSPSLSEGLSNTLLESMAAGVPVVATAVGGTPEAVRHGETGLLVPAGKPEAMADGVCQLLADPAATSRLAERARLSISERYSMSRVVDRTSQVYASLIQDRRTAGRRVPTSDLTSDLRA